MNFIPNKYYLIKNDGNNKNQVFFKPQNYKYLADKATKYLYPYCDILAWCFLPNGIQILLKVNEDGCHKKRFGSIDMPLLSHQIREMKRSFTKGVNKQENRSGCLFRHKFTAIEIKDIHLKQTTDQIHSSPIITGFAFNTSSWTYSSIHEYSSSSQSTPKINLVNYKVQNMATSKKMSNNKLNVKSTEISKGYNLDKDASYKIEYRPSIHCILHNFYINKYDFQTSNLSDTAFYNLKKYENSE